MANTSLKCCTTVVVDLSSWIFANGQSRVQRKVDGCTVHCSEGRGKGGRLALHCIAGRWIALHCVTMKWYTPVLDCTALKGVGQERKWRYQKAGFDLTQLDNVKSSILIPASSFSGRKYQISRRGPPKLPKRWKRRSCWGQPPTEELNSRRGITNFICDP